MQRQPDSSRRFHLTAGGVFLAAGLFVLFYRAGCMMVRSTERGS